jgi:hypothetical protein
MYRRECRSFLGTSSDRRAEPTNGWLVRDPFTANSDGVICDRCSRGWSTANEPIDVRLLRRRLSLECESSLVEPGDPTPMRRERIASKVIRRGPSAVA